MLMPATSQRASRVAVRSAARLLGHRWYRLVRRVREAGVAGALLLATASVAIGLAQSVVPQLPLVALVVPMVVGDQLLPPRTLPALVLLTLGVLAAVVSATQELLDGRRIGGVVVVAVVGLMVLATSFRRARLGVAGVRGESILVDLHERLRNQARMPVLPEGWYAEAALRSAGGSAFAGDFVVGARSPDGRSLEIAVVDVSGKGEQAGPRSLLLAGAFGGLLGALPAARFLPAANDYLLRQDWVEGFATAVHLSVDLDSGDFELRSAGHPPVVQLLAGSGRWVVRQVEGPALGLLPDADFPAYRGRLRRGDLLMLFTDGLVESAARDISLGIDKLLGQSERLLRAGVETVAHRLVERATQPGDDRALVLLHRR
ncbi:MAG: PP2C family protein-serine/threonine phosphatase [Nocardioidaceae bacterium]